ncbi:MAG: enoyl-CoA hydratase-related protein [Deltaproteobacteria bacterium]
MEYSTIRYEKEDHVVTITLNRPEVHNCISQAMSDELQVAWKTFRDDNDALVAIITGAGDEAFSAGGERLLLRGGPGDGSSGRHQDCG